MNALTALYAAFCPRRLCIDVANLLSHAIDLSNARSSKCGMAHCDPPCPAPSLPIALWSLDPHTVPAIRVMACATHDLSPALAAALGSSTSPYDGCPPRGPLCDEDDGFSDCPVPAECAISMCGDDDAVWSLLPFASPVARPVWLAGPVRCRFGTDCDGVAVSSSPSAVMSACDCFDRPPPRPLEASCAAISAAFAAATAAAAAAAAAADACCGVG